MKWRLSISFQMERIRGSLSGDNVLESIYEEDNLEDINDI